MESDIESVFTEGIFEMEDTMGDEVIEVVETRRRTLWVILLTIATIILCYIGLFVDIGESGSDWVSRLAAMSTMGLILLLSLIHI